MQKIIDTIELPDHSKYTIVDKTKTGIYTVKGTQKATTASWTGYLYDIDELYDGLTIAYYLPRTSASNVTLRLYLGWSYPYVDTGAIPVYVTGETRMSTHYAAGSTIYLTYWSAGSISVNGTATTAARWTSSDYYISNTDTKVRQTLATGDANRPLLMAYSANTDSTANVDNVAYRNNSIFANPSSGTITATKFVGSIADATGLSSSQITTALGYTPGSSNFSGAYADLSGKPTLGTAAAKAYTTSVTSGSADLVTSGAVYTSLNDKLDKSGGTLTGGLTLSSGNLTLNSGSITMTEGTSLTCGSDTSTSTHAVVAKHTRGKVYLDAHYESSYANSYVSLNSASNQSPGDDIKMIFRSCTVNSPTYLGGYVDGSYNSFALGGSNGARWDTIPVTSASGVTEIGKYLDFHASDTDTSNFTYRLVNTEDGVMTYSGTWSKASSRKIKENIKDIDLDEAKEIFSLRPVSFDYKEGYGQKNQRGLIAEEVEEVLPILVVDEIGEEGTEEWAPASVDYITIIPYLVKIIQDQEKRIIYLENKVNK